MSFIHKLERKDQRCKIINDNEIDQAVKEERDYLGQ